MTHVDLTLEAVRRALELSITPVAIEHVKAAEMDWACDLDEESRDFAKECARKMVNHIAHRLGVPPV